MIVVSREILFRSKRTDNGEWIEGYVYRISEKLNPFIMLKNRHSESYQVFIETVGQYTGMNDINGNKIYEGDIVHCKARIDRANMFVTFEDGKFVMVLCEEFKTHKRGLGHYEIECFDKEVIGNIYDNPELLTNENNG